MQQDYSCPPFHSVLTYVDLNDLQRLVDFNELTLIT